LAFIDFPKTCVTILKRQEIWNSLQRANVSVELMERIKNSYDKYRTRSSGKN
jgi:hypothetical protein